MSQKNNTFKFYLYTILGVFIIYIITFFTIKSIHNFTTFKILDSDFTRPIAYLFIFGLSVTYAKKLYAKFYKK